MYRQMIRSSVVVAAACGLSLMVFVNEAFAYSVGTIGDSYTAEYKYNNSTRYNHRNWVEQLAIASDTGNKSLDFGPIINTTAPRWKGFENNWALSGATTTDAIKNQLPGLKAQVVSKDLDIVYIGIGVNNIHNLYTATSSQRTATLNNVVNDIKYMVSQVRAADPDVKIVFSNIMNQTVWPSKASYTSAQRKAVSDAIKTANAALKAFAIAEHTPMIDAYKLMTDMDKAGFSFAGVTLDQSTVAGEKFEPANAMWADDSHAGSIYQGVFANTFLTALNKEYGQAFGAGGLKLLTNQQILDAAWRKNGQNAPKATSATFNYAGYIVVAPTPSVLAMGLVGMGIVLIKRRRVA